MDETHVVLVFAEKPCDVYVAVTKSTTSRQEVFVYLKEIYPVLSKWKHDMIQLLLEYKKTD